MEDGHGELNIIDVSGIMWQDPYVAAAKPETLRTQRSAENGEIVVTIATISWIPGSVVLLSP